METDYFTIHIRTEDAFKDIANDVEKRYDTSNCKVNRPLPTGKNEKVIGLMKDKLRGKVMIVFVKLRPKTYSDLMGNVNSDKKAKGTKTCVLKREINL